MERMRGKRPATPELHQAETLNRKVAVQLFQYLEHTRYQPESEHLGCYEGVTSLYFNSLRFALPRLASFLRYHKTAI